ncbi:hypothetical protein GWI33_003476, partial [Rhynchophorus ferrugineus]
SFNFTSLAAQKILKGVSINSVDTLMELNMAANNIEKQNNCEVDGDERTLPGSTKMDTLYTTRFHGFPNFSRSSLEPNISEESVLSLLIVLGSSVSLVALVFAFITYSLFSDLRNLSGTTLLNLLSTLFMTQLLYVIGVGSVLVST